jgi:hypothetical protein
MPDAVSGKWLAAAASAVGVRSVSGFDMTGPTSVTGGAQGGWPLQIGVGRSDTEGFPSPPSILLEQPGVWRFRWQLNPGSQTISCYTKQEANSAPYPSMVVKANPSIGVNVDVSASAPSGTGWKKIGPITIVATSPGVVWVELCANYAGQDASSANPLGPWYPCYFDNIDI